MSTPIHINLLDWRSEARETKRKRFFTLLAAAAAGSVLLAGVLPTLFYGHALARQQARNDYLQNRIDEADAKLAEIKTLKKTREDLVNRMHIIGELQHSRSGVVHYFDQLVATIPDGVYLTRLSQQGQTTTLDGIAESNARVSQYMTNLDGSDWFTNPRLIVITRDDSAGRARADFTLKVDSSAAPKSTGQASSAASAS